MVEVSLAELRRAVGCDVVGRPESMSVVARHRGRWLLALPEAGPRQVLLHNTVAMVRFIERHLPSAWPEGGWSLVYPRDGWGEHLGAAAQYEWVPADTVNVNTELHARPGTIPVLSAERPGVLCFGCRVGDPSAVLMPDPYLLEGKVQVGIADALASDRPWEAKASRFVFAGTHHGSPMNTPGHRWPNSRQHLSDHVAGSGLPVEVYEGGRSRAQLLEAKFLLDTDGFVRTWDAFAWKAASASVPLLVDSVWDIWWRPFFEPWEHFVPVAHDLADLGTVIEWCLANDDECRRIAERGAERAPEVFTEATAARAVAPRVEAHLAGELHSDLDVAPRWFSRSG
ncbi:MAG: hypothetical protein M3Z03_03700 [Actinomycetota bacterium]|nr:hypothetical protein [Actinomycetota bacterium]